MNTFMVYVTMLMVGTLFMADCIGVSNRDVRNELREDIRELRQELLNEAHKNVMRTNSSVHELHLEVIQRCNK
ncbi:MAG: hypothetical protein JWO15_3560 [Sphingomonadales bacterium]|nr:hypothetical protein [Sphingomonadales bacterium]